MTAIVCVRGLWRRRHQRNHKSNRNPLGRTHPVPQSHIEIVSLPPPISPSLNQKCSLRAALLFSRIFIVHCLSPFFFSSSLYIPIIKTTHIHSIHSSYNDNNPQQQSAHSTNRILWRKTGWRCWLNEWIKQMIQYARASSITIIILRTSIRHTNHAVMRANECIKWAVIH